MAREVPSVSRLNKALLDGMESCPGDRRCWCCRSLEWSNLVVGCDIDIAGKNLPDHSL